MDAPTPWRSYAAVRRIQRSHVEADASAAIALLRVSEREEDSTRGQASRLTLAGRELAKTRPRLRGLSRVPTLKRGWARDASGEIRQAQHLEVRAQGRLPFSHLKSERRENNIVYDRPISVLNEYILSGERDAEFWEGEKARDALLHRPRVVPRGAMQNPAHSRGLPFRARLQFLVDKKGSDPRFLFRLCTPAFAQAAQRVQCWWRQRRARRVLVALWNAKQSTGRT